MMTSESPWSELVPSIHIGSQGHELGYYHKIADYLFVVPLVLLLVVAVGYNVLVGFATRWMYANAWKKKSEAVSTHTESGDKPVFPKTNIWEEIFVVNMKLANYLLGDNTINLKLSADGFLSLNIQDYPVYMPLAMIMIQVSQVAVAMTLVVLFVDYFVLQVTHTCTLGKDCYSFTETNMTATPFDCTADIEYFRSANITNFTCFQLSLNPAIAAAITGGFLKTTPHILFSIVTFQFVKYIKIKYRLSRVMKTQFIIHIVLTVLLEICFIAVGIIALIVMLYVPSIYDISFHTANPMKRLIFIFGFVMYFMTVSFLWCIYPLTEAPVRFVTGIWKQSSSYGDYIKKYGSTEKMHPWVVVDHSLSTTEKLLN